jgi:hypothetical protein
VDWAAKPGEAPSREQEEKAAREEAARRLAQNKALEVQQKVQEFNTRERPKSLLEMHFEKDDEKGDKKKKKKEKKKKDKKKKDKKSKKNKKAVVTPMLGTLEVRFAVLRIVSVKL